MLARAYFGLGAMLVVASLIVVGPYMAQQAGYIWMAFGVGIALIAYGRTNVRRRGLSVALVVLGAVWIAALVFVIFGVAGP